MYRYRKTSITDQVRKSITSIAVLLAVPAIIGLVVMLIYASRTQAMTRRMNDVAQMKPALENTIAENLFSVAAGRISFEDSAVEELIDETDDTLDRLLGETQGRGQIQLTIARRTMDTLEQYVLKVREGMRAGEPISKIEGIVDEVRNVGRLITDMLDAFTTEEGISSPVRTVRNRQPSAKRGDTFAFASAVRRTGSLPAFLLIRCRSVGSWNRMPRRRRVSPPKFGFLFTRRA